MIRNTKIKINQGRILPSPVRLVGTLGIVAAIFLLFDYAPEREAILLSIPLSMLMPLIWSSFHILELNLETLEVAHFNWITGRKFNASSVQLKGPVRFQIKENEKIQDQFSTKRPVRSKRTFSCYLKDSDGKLVFLISDKSYDKLVKRLEPLVKKSRFEVFK